MDKVKKLSKPAKALIIIVAVLLVLAIVAITVLFTYVNSYKFMTYSSKKVNAAYASISTSDVKYIAHRGLSVEAYQNTQAAFNLAAEDPDIWGIETDVWATSDGNFVCMHDGDALKDIASSRDVTLEEALSAPLKKNEDERACDFDKYLAICERGNKTAVIEIKDKEMTEPELDLLMQKVNASGAKALYISFYFAKLKYIRSCDENAEMQYLITYGLSSDLKGATAKQKLQHAIDIRCDLSVYYQFMTKSLSDMFHKVGLKVGVWTVNNPKTAACLQYSYGVDYITTDLRKSALFED